MREALRWNEFTSDEVNVQSFILGTDENQVTFNVNTDISVGIQGEDDQAITTTGIITGGLPPASTTETLELETNDSNDFAEIELTFRFNVEDVSFRLAEIEEEVEITILAFDRDGNLVDVSFTDVGTGVTASPTTPATLIGDNGEHTAADPAASATVFVDEPIARLVIQIDNQATDATDNASPVISDVFFTSLVSSDDNLSGGDGADTVRGGDGTDTISGGAGDDDIFVGGRDVASGGSGDDVFAIDATDLSPNIAATIDGGSDATGTGTAVAPDDAANGDAGDILDFSGLTADDIGEDGITGVTVTYDSNPEDGIVTGLDGAEDGADLTFSEIENIIYTGDDDIADASAATSSVTVETGDGDDVLTGGNADDSLDGGAGNDTIQGGDGFDTIAGSEGNDDINDSDGGADITGGAGDDTVNVFGSAATVNVSGGTGNDDVTIFNAVGSSNTVDLGDGDDSFTGGDAVDVITGGDGDDVFSSGAGNDVLDGGTGDDIFNLFTGDDTVTGGLGNDIFIEGAAEGFDTITDFNIGNTGSINDGNQTNNDFVDLSNFYNTTSVAAINAAGGVFENALELMRADAADGQLDAQVGVVDYSSEIGDIDLILQDGSGGAITGTDLTFDNTNVVCFAAGTMIELKSGLRPIEQLEVGDRVLTHDNGLQEIRWIGSTRFTSADLKLNPKLFPIKIEKGALGDDMPSHDLFVSRQHRILVRSKIAERMFDEREILIPAIKLIALPGVTVEADIVEIEYFHMLFDRHEIVYSNGALSESLFTGPEALKSVSPEAREEITTIFPEIILEGYEPMPIRFIPAHGNITKQLVARHQKNARAIYVSSTW